MPPPGDRVALVLATSTGGVGQHIRSLAEQLVARGWQVAVLGPAATEELFAFTAAGAAFAPLEIAGGVDPVADARAARRLASLVRGADVVHAHGLRAGLVGAAALGRLRGRTGRPPAYVVTWHNAVLGGGVKRRIYGWLEGVVARSADVTLGASSDLVERVRALGGEDARLGPVSAPPLGPPTRPPAEVRSELGAGDRPLVLCIGRLHPQKGYPVLLDAARAWAGRDPVPLVAIAGSGPSEEALAARIAAEGLPVRLLAGASTCPICSPPPRSWCCPACGRRARSSPRRPCAPGSRWWRPGSGGSRSWWATPPCWSRTATPPHSPRPSTGCWTIPR